MIIEIPKGENIYGAARLAIEAARTHNEEVTFDFNGINLLVSRFSFAGDILAIYDLKCELRRLQS